LESNDTTLRNRVVSALPRVLYIVTWIGVLGVTARSIFTGNYSDAWIVLGAILIMDAVWNFGEFAVSKGFIKSSSNEMAAVIAVGRLIGVLLFWGFAKATIPATITGDFRIMGLIILAFMTLSLINWACKFRLSAGQVHQDRK